MGWLGRVMARTIAPIPPSVLTLAVPGETSTQMGARWENEAFRRFGPDVDNRLVIAVGRADAAQGISLARSRLNLANALDSAGERRLPAFVVGPPPGRPEHHNRLDDLTLALADVAGRRHVPYVDMFTPLAAHDQWVADMAAGDGELPGQAGYGLMAWLVLHTGWHAWLGLPADTD